MTLTTEGKGGATPRWTARLAEAAAAPVDGTSLAAVRIAVGAVVVLSAVRTWAYGWTDSLYAGTTHRFTYLGLGWVPQPGPFAIRALVAATAVAGIAIALGWRTRLAFAVLLVSFGWIELIDVTTYLNHYWFVTLVAVLGLVVPFGTAWSLDARRAARRGRPPGTVAAGWVWLLRFQVGLVYASAGLAKLHGDWLLRALPLRFWLPARRDLAVIGPLLEPAATAHVAAIAGAAFDCLVVPALLWRRTRPFAWAAVVAFHVITWALFPIGVFPWLMIAMATVFFEPAWPRDLLRWARARLGQRASPSPATPAAPDTPAAPVALAVPRRRATATALVAGCWVLVMLALPLRHLAYPGDHRWTGEGYRFGWNVLLVERVASVTFLVHDPASGRTWTADPSVLYTEAQLRAMRSEPDLIHQAAIAIADDEAGRGHPGVEVRVDAWMSFNGRPAARWIDPEVDLAAEPRSPWHKPWIIGG